MGKEKQPPGSALTRMNFLYQAAFLMSKNHSNNKLSNYFNKLLKEISKKMVEKLHPDLKRTICFACDHSLIATKQHINVKVKSFQQKRKRKKIVYDSCDHKFVKSVNSNTCKYQTKRKDVRTKKPNKIWYSCSQCQMKKGYLQDPKYKIWIHELHDFSDISDDQRNSNN